MNEKQQGLVIPFRMSGSKMRSRAAEYRRQGQVLDAMTLMRRAAEQDDTAVAWQALATELRQLGCWESAAVILSRVLTRNDRAASAWLDLARCHAALNQKELAMDCLYHVLKEDPWSPEGDMARSMLAEVSLSAGYAEPRRAARLAKRGMQAWYAGDMALANRRIRRAVRLVGEKEQLMVTVGLMHMLRWDLAGAERWLARALRCNPRSPRALCAFSAVCQQRGRRRMARAFLRKAQPWCITPDMEEQFLTAAWVLDAWPEMETCLEQRLKREPFRIALLNAKATMRHEQGRPDEARQLWKQILALDPEDRRAASLLSFTQDVPEAPVLPAPGRLPRDAMEAQRAQLREAAEADVFRFGSRENILLAWFVSSAEAEEQKLAIETLMKHGDREGAQRFLREMLTRPDVPPALRQFAVVQLAEMGCTEPMTMLVGDCYTEVQCQRVERREGRVQWRSFLLLLLLRETRRYGQSAQIARFAAMLWNQMTPDQREDAAGSGGYLWCKAMEVLWLRLSGQEDRAVQLVLDMPVSPRRVSRILRRLGKAIQYDPAMPEEEET